MHEDSCPGLMSPATDVSWGDCCYLPAAVGSDIVKAHLVQGGGGEEVVSRKQSQIPIIKKSSRPSAKKFEGC